MRSISYRSNEIRSAVINLITLFCLALHAESGKVQNRASCIFFQIMRFFKKIPCYVTLVTRDMREVGMTVFHTYLFLSFCEVLSFYMCLCSFPFFGFLYTFRVCDMRRERDSSNIKNKHLHVNVIGLDAPSRYFESFDYRKVFAKAKR